MDNSITIDVRKIRFFIKNKAISSETIGAETGIPVEETQQYRETGDISKMTYDTARKLQDLYDRNPPIITVSWYRELREELLKDIREGYIHEDIWIERKPDYNMPYSPVVDYFFEPTEGMEKLDSRELLLELEKYME